MVTPQSRLFANSGVSDQDRLDGAVKTHTKGTRMSEAKHKNYDVVIIGGAMIGSAVAWYLSTNADFQGRILVVERDPSYQFASTAHSHSCMRQQFSTAINVRISQYCAEFVRDFRTLIGAAEAPEIAVHYFGYLYLANSAELARRLRRNQQMQAALGAGTQILTRANLARRFPFFKLDDIVLGSLNTRDEGYFDGNTIFDWWRRMARRAGVEYLADEVVGITRARDRVSGISLASGGNISCAAIVNAAGPRCARVAAMAGLAIPVEPRRRYTFVIEAETRLDRDLPLTVDGSGVHVRSDGRYYLAGGAPDVDLAVAPDDFSIDHSIWEEKFWPLIAARIPAFAAVKVINSWVGHYAYNAFDQNAIVGPHSEVANFLFVNGFSGHGFQQAPAMGRGVAELITYGSYQTLDLSALGYGRLVENLDHREGAVI